MINPHSNNFDSLRFLFASFVIITHSYALSGFESEEILSKLTNGQLYFSYLGLRGFFIISGFLIYQSFERSGSIIDFIWKRFVRVFPGLLMVTIVTAFIVGPLISSLSYKDYFANNEPWLFFIHSVNLFSNITHKCLPGIFVYNPRGCEVNGSLWTITYEFLFYIGLIALFVFKNKYAGKILLLLTLVLIYFIKRIYVYPYIKYEYFIANTSIGVKAATDFGCFFLLGSIFASFKFNKLSTQLNKTVLITSSIIFIFLLYKNVFNAFPIIIVPMVLSWGLLKFNLFPFIKKTGDISYGTYLYGFLVQQILIQYCHPGTYVLIAYSLIASYFLGWLSWHLVEKPSLRFKNFFATHTNFKIWN